jgi:hypothetical protein
VPNWSVFYTWQPLDSTEDQYLHRYNTARGTTAKSYFKSDHPRALFVRGFQIGIVDWLGDTQEFDKKEVINYSWPQCQRRNLDAVGSVINQGSAVLLRWEEKVQKIGTIAPFSLFGKGQTQYDLALTLNGRRTPTKRRYPLTKETYNKVFRRTLVAGHSTADPIINGNPDDRE